MSPSPLKREISVQIDAQLLDDIDKLSGDRSAVFEEALRLWRAQRIEERLRQFYQNRSQADVAAEEEWGRFSQEQLEETLDTESLS